MATQHKLESMFIATLGYLLYSYGILGDCVRALDSPTDAEVHPAMTGKDRGPHLLGID